MSSEAPDADQNLQGRRKSDSANSDGLGQRDRLLQKALRPILQSSIVEAFQSQGQSMVDSLYPLVGRAVRRSVRESLKSLAESIDRTMRNALTMKRLRWRWQAKRQGVSVSELILRESLLYRVEEVFCIHRETGLMVDHAGQRADEGRDLVSGMFTAIQDFVADSFRDEEDRGEEPENLERFQAGEQDVWLVHGPVAYLAIVISGEAPTNLRDDFNTVLESIHERFGTKLTAFDGDPEPYAELRLWLEDCLVERKRDAKRSNPILFQLLVGAVCLGLVYAGWLWYQQGQVHQKTKDQLRQLPGVVINKEWRGWRKSEFDLLVDPGVQSEVNAIGIEFEDHCELRSEPFFSPALEAVRRRLLQAWRSEDNQFELAVADDGLIVLGEVSHRWLSEVQSVENHPGVAIDFSKVINRDQVAFDGMAQALSSLSVAFLPGVSKVAPGESPKWLRLAKQMKAILKLSEARGFEVNFGLYAVPGSDLVDESEIALAEARGLQARSQLHAQGLPAELLTWHGLLPTTIKLPREPVPSSIVVLPLFVSHSENP